MTAAPDLSAAVERLRELLAKATPGPWLIHADTYVVICKYRGPGNESLRVLEVAHNSRRDEGRYNRDLVVAAINLLPQLLSAAERAAEDAIPRDPTDAMSQAGMTALSGTPTTICIGDLDDAYRAMYDAALARPLPTTNGG